MFHLHCSFPLLNYFLKMLLQKKKQLLGKRFTPNESKANTGTNLFLVSLSRPDCNDQIKTFSSCSLNRCFLYQGNNKRTFQMHFLQENFSSFDAKEASASLRRLKIVKYSFLHRSFNILKLL